MRAVLVLVCSLLKVAPPAPLWRTLWCPGIMSEIDISLTVLRRGVKRQAHVVLLADQNDEHRLFQVLEILWCMVSMQIYCFSSNMAYNHVMTKKKRFLGKHREECTYLLI